MVAWAEFIIGIIFGLGLSAGFPKLPAALNVMIHNFKDAQKKAKEEKAKEVKTQMPKELPL